MYHHQDNNIYRIYQAYHFYAYYINKQNVLTIIDLILKKADENIKVLAADIMYSIIRWPCESDYKTTLNSI